ncbi:MAG: glycosyltransferase family 2 protein [Clostridia bacterium]|nr:glycosyltransferase family 2 protein [Clostridia bacterium]
MQELVSIVVPVYNVEKYLDRCIKSIINQTYENLEIILVDDGSTDSSPRMCDSYAEKDNRIKVLHKENAGAGLARNSGLELATGRYIFFFDSDDYVDTTTVEKCVNTAKSKKADVVMFGRCNVYDDGTVKEDKLPESDIEFVGESVKNQLLPGLFTYELGFGISVWGKMFDLNIIRSSGISYMSEREVFSEDAVFILDVFSKVRKVSVLCENLYYYYKNDNSYSRTYKSNHQPLCDEFLSVCTEHAEQFNYPQKVVNYIKSRYHTYSLVGMKQLVASDLPKNEKKCELRKIFRNPFLRETLSGEVVRLDILPSRVFWTFLRCRCYGICTLLLSYKASK